MRVALKPYGEKGILAHDLSDPERTGLCRALAGERPEGCVEYVQGYDTVLFIFKQNTPTKELAEWLRSVAAVKPKRLKGTIHQIPVVYDGADLQSVAKQAGLSIDEVVEIHSSPIYSVRMMGFTPGFPYLDGLDERLHLPRKHSPRKRIEVGSVAIGGSHAGIYSVASPGGWHLLGRTDLPLFNPEAAMGGASDCEKAFLFSPGDRLRFEPIL